MIWDRHKRSILTTLMIHGFNYFHFDKLKKQAVVVYQRV